MLACEEKPACTRSNPCGPKPAEACCLLTPRAVMEVSGNARATYETGADGCSSRPAGAVRGPSRSDDRTASCAVVDRQAKHAGGLQSLRLGESRRAQGRR